MGLTCRTPEFSVTMQPSLQIDETRLEAYTSCTHTSRTLTKFATHHSHTRTNDYVVPIHHIPFNAHMRPLRQHPSLTGYPPARFSTEHINFPGIAYFSPAGSYTLAAHQFPHLPPWLESFSRILGLTTRVSYLVLQHACRCLVLQLCQPITSMRNLRCVIVV